MAEAILYCDRCAKLVPPSELSSGAAVRAGDSVFCSGCVAHLPARPHAPAPRPAPRRTTPGAGTGARATSGRGNRHVALFVAALATGLATSVIVTSLVIGGNSTNQDPRRETRARPHPNTSVAAPARGQARPDPAPPTVATPVAAPAPVASAPPTPAPAPASTTDTTNATASADLDRIRDLLDPSGSKLDEIRRLVEELLGAHPGSPQAEEAKSILAKAEQAFVTQAESNLKSAMDQAEALLTRGMFDQAARSFSYVKMLYGTSAWFEQSAKGRIDEVLARIAAAKEKLATAGVALRDEFADGADASWDMPGGWQTEGGALIASTPGNAIAGLPAGGVVTVEAVVEVKSREGGGHTAAGLIIRKDGANFWYLGLCEAPDGPRYAEFHESFNGQWMAQINGSKLTSSSSGDIGWNFGEPYRLVIELRKDSIAGIIKTADGRERSRTTYTFDNDAVRVGRPGLTARSCIVKFDDFNARVIDAGDAN